MQFPLLRFLQRNERSSGGCFSRESIPLLIFFQNNRLYQEITGQEQEENNLLFLKEQEEWGKKKRKRKAAISMYKKTTKGHRLVQGFPSRQTIINGKSFFAGLFLYFY